MAKTKPVDLNQLRVGGLYWIQAQGPMEVLEIPKLDAKKKIVLCRNHGGVRYWAASDQIYDLPLETFTRFMQQSKARGLDVPQTWYEKAVEDAKRQDSPV